MDEFREDTQLITTFLNLNTPSKKGQPGEGYLKTITNRFSNTSSSIPILKDEGFGSLKDIFGMSENTSINERVNDFRTLSSNRYRQYGIYEQMAEDPIISSALDLYADDATQPDSSGSRMWIQSDDPDVERLVQSLFSSTYMEERLWTITRSLATYGDVYLELFYDETVPNAEVKLLEKRSVKDAITKKDYTNNLLEVEKLSHLTSRNSKGFALSRFELVQDVENIFDLSIEGQTVAYARIIQDDISYNSNLGYIMPNNGGRIRYYPPDKFVHIYIENPNTRTREKFVVDIDSQTQLAFDIVRGKSMIHDAFTAQRDLQLLEYSMMLNRVSRSAVLRIAQLEVGNMSKANVQTALRKLKQIIENKTTLNTEDKTYQPYLNPGPIENFIYLPVKDGKGGVTFDTVGGDVNIKDIADIEHYQDKLFAVLKVPKTYLNYSEAFSALNSDGGLTKQDARYARTIKRLKHFVDSGVEEFMNILLTTRGLGQHVDDFEVRSVPPSSIEDEERDAQFSNKMDLAKSFLEIVSSLTESEAIEADSNELINYISTSIFDDSDIKKILKVIKLPDGVEGTIGDISGNSVEVETTGGGSSARDVDTGYETGRGSTADVGDLEGEFGGEWEDLEL